ncbi:MAG: hypothetical protein ACUVXG_01155 [Anaerolineae bacterium]
MPKEGNWLLLVLVVVLLAACVRAPAKTATPAPTPTAAAPEKRAEEPVGMPVAQDKERSVALCTAHLSERLAVPPEKIQVLKAEPVDWPDTSLGCPEPGMMYAQVITPGFRVSLQVGDRIYEYHTDGKRAVTCE